MRINKLVIEYCCARGFSFNKIFLLAFYFFVCSTSNILSQSSYAFEKLSENPGISQSITYAIDQDSIGNIWIGTEEGVIKYNSKSVVNYNKYRGLPEGASNRIENVFIDDDNDIWIGSDKGVCRYNAKIDLFEKIGPTEEASPILVKDFLQVGNKIYIAAFNGLWSWNKENNDKFQNLISNNIINTLHHSNGQLLCGSSNGLLIIDLRNPIKDANTPYLQGIGITDIVEINGKFYFGTVDNGVLQSGKTWKDIKKIPVVRNNYLVSDLEYNQKDSTLFVGMDGNGVLKLNDKMEVVDHFYHNEDDLNSISSNGVYDILIGKEKILWVATYGGGVNLLNPDKSLFLKIYHKVNDSNSIVNSFTRAIEEDKNGNIWFGTKKGISIWHPVSKIWKHIDNLSSIILSLEKDGEAMWAGTYNDGLYKIDINTYRPTKIKSYYGKDIHLHKVYTILKDTQDNLWVGGIDRNLTVLTKSGKLLEFPLSQIKTIIETSVGEILAAGRNGVFQIELNTRQISPLERLMTGNSQLTYYTINALQESSAQKLLIATNGSGLLMYDRTIDKVDIIDGSKGMPSDIIQGILEFTVDEYWASTTKGLVRISINDSDTLITTFEKNDGLSSTEFNYGSYSKLKDGRFAFGGVEGVTIFSPADLLITDLQPEVVLESFSIFNQEILPGQTPLDKHINIAEEVVLNYQQNSITFSYAGVTHSNQAKVKYTYQLEGLDDNWSTPNKVNQVNYTNLDPGEYIFKVKASAKENVWGPIKSLPILIQDPWYLTTTAYLIYGLLGMVLLAAIFYFTKFILNKRQTEEQIRFFSNITHEIKTPLAILMSTLDNATGEQKNENQKAKSTIKRINSLFEQMLNFQKVARSNNPLQNITKFRIDKYVDKTLDNFRPLLEKEKLRITVLNDWGHDPFYYDIDNVNKILYNLLSNAIKYSKPEGEIRIHLSRKSHDLLLEVSDDGIGIPEDQQKFILKKFYRARNVVNSQKPGTGLGLMMVKKLVIKAGGSISFHSRQGEGTTFTVLLKNQKRNYLPVVQADSGISINYQVESTAKIEEYSEHKILIVEDNDELRDSLVMALSNYFVIEEARNGKVGLAKAAEFYPDLIITDLIMPEMDGMEMVEAIKQDINLNHIPIFMLTVLRSSIQKIQSLESGIVEYFEKPVDFKVLLAHITGMFNLQKRLRERFKNKSEIEEAVEYRTKQDQEFVQELESFILEKIKDEALSVHDLCHFVGMSRTSLYMKMKNLIDLSPQDFIIHTKLKHAKNLLIKGGASIKEISYLSGFSNPKYFSTSFKKFYGLSPSKYLTRLEDSNS